MNPIEIINEGVKFYDNQEYGQALASFYEAKKIIPRHSRLNKNLKITLDQIGLKQAPMFGYEYLTLTEALILLLIFNILFLVRAKFSQFIRSIIICAFFASICVASIIGLQQKLIHYAFVISPSTKGYSGDGESYPEVAELMEGQIVLVKKISQDWIQVHYQDEILWIRKENCILK